MSESRPPDLTTHPMVKRNAGNRWLDYLLSGEFKLWMIGVICLVPGVVLLAWQELRMLSWVRTEGRVLWSETIWIGQSISIQVRYRYQSGGHEYECDRLTTGEPPRFLTVQESGAYRRTHFPPGRPVMVYYAWYDPNDATLTVERNHGIWAVIGMGVFHLALAYRWRRSRLRQAEEAGASNSVPRPPS